MQNVGVDLHNSVTEVEVLLTYLCWGGGGGGGEGCKWGGEVGYVKVVREEEREVDRAGERIK